MSSASKRTAAAPEPRIAYFSMEVALESHLPTYSGGLGVLAGDTLRAAADLSLPAVGITLAHRKGYLRQHLDAEGNQSDTPAGWRPEDHLVEARATWTAISPIISTAATLATGWRRRRCWASAASPSCARWGTGASTPST
jgi:glucan phosphorylase